MKRTYLLLSLALIFVMAGFQNLKAAEGDTIKVESHDETHWNWYSSNNQWTVFPASGNSYRKIMLNYTLGCPIGGCSEWDYTTAIYANIPTGEMDSTLQTAPMFTVDNNEVDSVRFSMDTTYTTFYSGSGTDSTANTAMAIVEFNDPQNPTVATGLVWGWPVDYTNSYYDAGGNVLYTIDVGPDTVWYLTYHQYYNVFEKIDAIELARVMTPYNGGVQNGWEHTWQFDVTDFAPILHDSVEINAFYGGWQDGFLITLDFEMIEGTPPRDPLKVNQVYHSGGGGFKYGVASDPIENHLVPTDIAIGSNTEQAILYFSASGHSFGGNENCAEFCQKNYYLNVDGTQVGSKLIWKDDCDINPIYPQGGTWLYDRGGWCPGDRTTRNEHELTQYITAGSPLEIDIDMQAYTYTGGASFDPNYIMECQLIEFGGVNHQNDVEVYNILAPNNDFNYNRFNPVCDAAKVVIRNSGEQTLTSCTIVYYIEGGNYKTFNWTGSLDFLETEEVELPLDPADWYAWGGPANVFKVVVSEPNGVADEYEFNNRMEAPFDFPPMYDGDIIVWYKPNSAPTETTLEILDLQGNVMWSRGPSGLSAGTIYKDTISLPEGCYVTHVTDTDGDGIAFWANNDGGGFFRFRAIGGQTIKNFEPDFGGELIHHFTVGYTLGAPTYEVEADLNVYPNPSEGIFSMEIDGFDGERLAIQVFDLQGKLLHEENINNPEDFVYKELDITHLAKGTYFIKVLNENGAMTKMVVKQ